MAKNHDYEETEFITLTFDEGVNVECAVIDYFEADGRSYVALLPENVPDGLEFGPEEVLLYRYTELDGDEFLLEAIESDEEFEVAADKFDELLDTMAFNEME